jgi:hypothetical protein
MGVEPTDERAGTRATVLKTAYPCSSASTHIFLHRAPRRCARRNSSRIDEQVNQHIFNFEAEWIVPSLDQCRCALRI